MDTDIKYWHLRNHQLFDQLSDKEVADLCIMMAFKKAKKGEIIYFSDQTMEKIFILKKGRIRIAYHNNEGEEITTEILKEGDLFGEVALNAPTGGNKEFAQAISDEVSCCAFSVDNFKNLLRQKPELAVNYSQQIGEKLRSVGTRYSDLIFKDVRERVINFFKLHAHHDGVKNGNRIEIEMYLTHQDIANIIASSRQTTTSIINELIKEGKIDYVNRKRMVIPDITKL